MPDLYKGKIPICRRSLNEGFIRGTPDEEPVGGCVERDYDEDPPAVGNSPAEMVLIEPGDRDAIYDQAEEMENSLEHLYLRGDRPAFEHLDQGRFPDCWAHSVAHCLMLDRLKQHLDVVPVNAVAVATMIGRTNGGWSGLSLKWTGENGWPTFGEWPKWTRDRKYDTPALRQSMKTRRLDEAWYDLGRREWDQKLARRQLSTCSANNIPCGVDYNRHGHAMCFLREVRIERGVWGDLILNSWQGFGYHGLCVLVEEPNNAVGLRSSFPFAS